MADLTATNPGDIRLDTTNEPVFLRSQPSEVLKVVILGGLVGIMTAVIAWLLQRSVIGPVFCDTATTGVCAAGGLTAYYIATVLTGLVATVILANWQVFRPLLIVIATIATLWGFKKYALNVAEDSPVEYYAYSAILFALSYLLFYWLLRLHNFVVSLLFVIVAVVGIRLFIVS